MRVKIIRDYEQYRVGQVVNVTKVRAKLLIQSGAAVITRDMISRDMKVK